MIYAYPIYPLVDEKSAELFKVVVTPIVESCGYQTLNLDRIAASDFAIDSADKLITMCDVCIADISSDNPNVWYEVGYAYSAKKDVILLCCNERTTPYPFSISHRSVLKYGANSPTDFRLFEDRLKQRLLQLSGSEPPKAVASTDIDILTLVYGLQYAPNEVVPLKKILAQAKDREDVVRMKTTLKRLDAGGFLSVIFSVDEEDRREIYYKVTNGGLNAIGNSAHDKQATNAASAMITFEQDGTGSLQIGHVTGGVVNVTLPKA